MATSLANAMVNGGLAKGYAEVRRYVAAKAVTINDKLATSWDQTVELGDIIKLGKRATCVVR